jgi:hypothetical protein
METNADEDAGVAAGKLRTITPHLTPRVMRQLCAFIEVKQREEPDGVSPALRRLNTLWKDERTSLELRAVAMVLADLVDQGWAIFVRDEELVLLPPGLQTYGETREAAKDRLRRALQTGRDRQLQTPGVQAFLDRMHRVVARPQGKTSIADVIENGAELAELLRGVASLPIDQQLDRLRGLIEPVIEVADDTARCSVTGLKLMDIWRYFRHTWSLEYRSMPGRQMALLIRNAARPNRPLMGIAMLASPVVRMGARDAWIGWTTPALLQRLQSGTLDPARALSALVKRLNQSIAEIRHDDLVRAEEIDNPTERTIMRLEQRTAGAAAHRQRELQEAYALSQDGDAPDAGSPRRTDIRGDLAKVDWWAASEQTLFVRKRAETLASLLAAKRTFATLDWTADARSLVEQLLKSPAGIRAVDVALREVRKAGLSSQVADVSVCGAVPPYNDLIGGKLVALLMTSEEVRAAYRKRYTGQTSIISSQMAGKPITRPAELKVLTTTSLYGNYSTQYSKLRLERSRHSELPADIRWEALESKTNGYGTVHLGSETVQLLREVGRRSYQAQRINHRFGEGASPRLRQIREALGALGIDSTYVLHHATPRIAYVCELYPGALDELLGVADSDSASPATVPAIAAVWRRRWVANRIQQPDVLARIETQGAAALREFFSRFAVGPTDADEDDSVDSQDIEDSDHGHEDVIDERDNSNISAPG